jgi:hypothetical protein
MVATSARVQSSNNLLVERLSTKCSLGLKVNFCNLFLQRKWKDLRGMYGKLKRECRVSRR